MFNICYTHQSILIIHTQTLEGKIEIYWKQFTEYESTLIADATELCPFNCKLLIESV